MIKSSPSAQIHAESNKAEEPRERASVAPKEDGPTEPKEQPDAVPKEDEATKKRRIEKETTGKFPLDGEIEVFRVREFVVLVVARKKVERLVDRKVQGLVGRGARNRRRERKTLPQGLS